MISDYNLKALVFDDVEEEAKPLIDALNYERIPNIYINFKNDDRGDEKKVQNIRIIFTDLIVGPYISGDDKNSVEAIRAGILDNISHDNGPFILVAWSKHSSLVETLKERILQVEPGLNFVTVELSKNDYFEQNADEWKLKEGVDFKNISSAIKEQLTDLEHMEIFLEWEQDARNSISKVLNNFIEDISAVDKVKKIVSTTIKSTLGERVSANSKDKLDAFYHTLNSTLADSIENNVAPESKHDNFLNSLDLENIDSNMNALINKKTLFEDCNDDKTLKTGNIYSFEDFKSTFSEQVIKEVCGYDADKIIGRDFFQHSPEDKEEDGNIIARFCKNLCRTKEEGQDLIAKGKLNKECRELTNNGMYPILMEFTPSCDIANNKYTKSRLIFGYLFDSKLKCIKNKSESLYMTSFHFKYKDDTRGLDSNYRLVFFIKNIFAVNPENVKQITPMLRARKEFATDLQHAIANHISRIGISSVDGF